MIHGYHDTRQVFLANGIELKPGDSQAVASHSLDGFNWGYCGSGASQLALAILLVFTTHEEALKHYQDFKLEVLSNFPIHKDFYLAPDEVRDWLDERGAA